MRFTIPSDYAAGREVEDKILAEAADKGFDPESLFGIRLALDEALINAIKHGNHCDPNKTVTIEASISPARCSISVEDQGAGFCRCDVPDPTAPENLEKCCGRGILLMESYMNKVQWSNDGRRVTMIRERGKDVC